MSAIAPGIRAQVAQRLGREPRGLRGVAVADAAGAPMVIRVASVVDGKPFPTLFWLVDPALCLRIDRDEAGGRIAALQALVDADEGLRSAMTEDHRLHILLRNSYLSAAERAQLRDAGLGRALSERGIGGIADFTRIRCLHTWYAAHLVMSNTIGHLLDRCWQGEDAAAL